MNYMENEYSGYTKKLCKVMDAQFKEDFDKKHPNYKSYIYLVLLDVETNRRYPLMLTVDVIQEYILKGIKNLTTKDLISLADALRARTDPLHFYVNESEHDPEKFYEPKRKNKKRWRKPRRYNNTQKVQN